MSPSTSRPSAIDPDRPLTQCLHRIWQVQQGLPQSTIHSILQTKDGYIWLGTPKGLVRFDGARFTAIQDLDGISLKEAWIRDLAQDESGSLWILADPSKLVRLKGGRATAFDLTGETSIGDPQRLIAIGDNQLWIGGSKGLVRFESEKAVEFEDGSGAPKLDVHAFALDGDNAHWVGGRGNKVYREREQRFNVITLTSLPPHVLIHSILALPNGSVLFGTSHGLVQRTNDRETRVTQNDGLPNDWILSLSAGKNGIVWVGTKDGFCRIHGKEIEEFQSKDGLSQSTCYALCEDREGSLWVGTKHGLNQFLDRRTIPFTIDEGLPSNNTGPVMQDSRGNVWVGTLDAGLSRFDGRRFTNPKMEKPFTGSSIHSLMESANKDVWIGTNKGIDVIRDGKIAKSFTQWDGLPSEMVRCLYRAQDGTIWVGTPSGLARLAGNQFEVVGTDQASKTIPIVAISELNSGILVSTDSGDMLVWNGERFEKFTRVAANAKVSAFLRDPDGSLWIGTRGDGLYFFNGQSTTHFSLKDGLYDDEIFGIVADDQQRLWMACSKGIFSLERSALRDFSEQKITALTSTPFSPTDALRVVECKAYVDPVACKSNDGRIWFSTIHGIIVVDPRKLVRNLPASPVVIEEITVNGKSESPQAVSSLPPGSSNISFRYSALSFASPTRITFQYRLEGFEDRWVEAGTRREAFFTNLAPGKYRFRVAATNVDGSVHEAEPIDFKLQPYFYQMRWFVPSCVIALLLLAWFVYRFRVRHLKGKMHTIVTERSRIARELHDTLMQGFSGITMQMQALSNMLPHSESRNTLESIIRDAGLCLREARRSVAGLRNEREEQSGLILALTEASRQITELRDFRLKLALEPISQRLPREVEYNLLRIAQEAITNAVNHSKGTTIEVALHSNSQQLTMKICDDGIGFDFENDTNEDRPSFGIVGMRERAAQIGAVIELESKLGRGVCISIHLPIRQESAKVETFISPGLPVAEH